MKYIDEYLFSFYPANKWKIEIPENIDMVFDCTGKIMDRNMRLGNLINAKLRLTATLEHEEDVRLFKGETLSKDLFMEFRKKEDDRKLWPVLMSTERERILIEANPGIKALTVKYGRWHDGVSVLEGETLGAMEGDYVDSAFTCLWADLSSGRKREVFRGETTKIGEFWIATAETGKFTASVSLSGCPYKAGRERQQTECSLKVVIGN